MNGTPAELIGRQCYRLPLRAALLHKLSIVIQLDGEKHISVCVKVVNFPAVEINVYVFYFVRKDKDSGMPLPEDFLPLCQPVYVLSRDPAFKPPANLAKLVPLKLLPFTSAIIVC